MSFFSLKAVSMGSSSVTMEKFISHNRGVHQSAHEVHQPLILDITAPSSPGKCVMRSRPDMSHGYNEVLHHFNTLLLYTVTLAIYFF